MNEPNTEPPPPPPEPPKARHPLAWLVFLLLCVVTFVPPLVTPDCSIETHPVLTYFFLAMFVLLLLCFYLGVVLERWLDMENFRAARAFGYGCLLVLVNVFLSYAGCDFGSMLHCKISCP